MNFNYIPKTMPNGRTYETTFHYDFDIAEQFGMKAIKDTFERAFKEWKTNIEYITELGIVMNIRCWYWYEQGNTMLSEYYAERWYQIRDFVYSDNFGEKEQSYFFDLTD